MPQQSLIEYFIAEAEDHLNLLEKGFLNLENNPGDFSGIEDMFRAAHTLKGSAALVKLNEISKIAHMIEDVFEEIQEGKRKITSSLATWMFKGIDTIKWLIKNVQAGKAEDPTVFKSFESALPSLSGEVSASITFEEEVIMAETVEAGDESDALEVLEDVFEIDEAVPSQSIEEKRGAGRRRDDAETLESKFVRIDIEIV